MNLFLSSKNNFIRIFKNEKRNNLKSIAKFIILILIISSVFYLFLGNMTKNITASNVDKSSSLNLQSNYVANITEISRYEQEIDIKDVAYVSETAYLSLYGLLGEDDDDGIYLDISDPTNMVEIGRNSMETGYIEFLGGHLLSTTTEGIDIIDITDVENPVLISSFGNRTFHIACNYTHVISAYSDRSNPSLIKEGLAIYNVTDRANPIEYGYLEYFLSSSSINDLIFRDDFVCMTTDVYDGPGNFITFDISNVSEPILAANISLSTDSIHPQICFSETEPIVYLTLGNEKLFVYDISDIYNPVKIGEYIANNLPAQGHLHNMILDGSNLYVSGLTGFEVINVTDPSNPMLIDRYNFEDKIALKNLHISNSVLYATYTYGMIAFNIDITTKSISLFNSQIILSLSLQLSLVIVLIIQKKKKKR